MSLSRPKRKASDTTLDTKEEDVYVINFLRPASGCFLYLVSKGRSTGCARNDNSVSISFPTVYQKSIGTWLLNRCSNEKV